MIITFGDFSFTPTTGLLVKAGKQQDQYLTPTESRILESLYLNRDRIVPRDELLKQVIDGRVIGADNITTHIKNIRKALQDSASKPKYIRTYQSSGYRFIASISQQPAGQKSNQFFKSGITLLAAFLMMVIFLLAQYQSSRQKVLQLPVAITSLKGNEIEGDATANGQYVVFSHKASGQVHWNLIIKKIGEENYFQLTDDNIHDRQAKFSPSGNQLIYHHYDTNINQILMAQINWENKQLQKVEVLAEFPAKLSSIYLDWKDQRTIYFSSSDSRELPFRISELDIIDKQIKRITQPTGNGHGDLGVTYSATANKLAVLRNVGWSKTDVMIYDPVHNSMTKLASLPQLLMSVAWTEDGTGLVLRTGIGQLGLLSLSSGKIKSLLKYNSPIYTPFTLPDQSVGFMRGDLIVSDIVQSDVRDSTVEKAAISSSFNDYRPAFAQQSKSLAFVSTRAGETQIWIKEEDGSLSQVSHFEQALRISNMAIDSKARFITYTANAEIHLMEVATGNLLFSSGADQPEHNNPIFSRDGQYLIYAVKNNDFWQLEKRRLDNLPVRSILTEGYIAMPCEREQCMYFIKRNRPTLYLLTSQGNVIDTGIEIAGIEYTSQMHLVDNRIYFSGESEGQQGLFVYDLNSNKKEWLMAISNPRFAFDYVNKIAYWRSRFENDTNLEFIPIR